MSTDVGTEISLDRMIAVFAVSKPHCAYLFANRRANAAVVHLLS